MATQNTVSGTLAWLYAFLVGRPTTGVGGFTNEPGLTSANLTVQTILAPPFGWQWNRNSTTFPTTVGTVDYQIPLTDFGWLEKATSFFAANTPPIMELEIELVLAGDGTEGQPFKIAPFQDDNAGNITFRIFPIPDEVYQITLTYQKSPIPLTLAGTWAPIPDKLAFLYERGLKAMMHGMYNTQLYMMEMSLFFRQLVAASEGLTESQKALFLEESLRRVRTEADAMIGTQQGRGSRLTS